MERWVGDWGIKHKLRAKKLVDEKRPEKVAVVGGGPAGLSCAYQLARRGYAVTVFEGAPKAGGMLRYGIPSYRLPDEVLDAEIQAILDLGVELRTGVQVGRDVAMDDLRRDYQAVYLAIGAQKGVNLGLPGEDAPNCFSGVDFLHRVRVGEKIDVGDKVIVIGGGNTAIDAARTSRRLGAHVTLLYRRTRKEMPAIEHEITEAEHEGVAYEFLSAPLEVVVKDGRAVAVKCQRMELGEPDASGRRRPVAGRRLGVRGPLHRGHRRHQPDPGLDRHRGVPRREGLDRRQRGPRDLGPRRLRRRRRHGRPRHRDAGDRPRPPGGGGHRPQVPQPAGAPSPDPRKIVRADQIIGLQLNEKKPRQERRQIPVAERIVDFRECDTTYEESEAVTESKRCLSCGLCCDCDNCFMYCQAKAIERLDKSLPIGQHYKAIFEKCIGCKKCAEACLCGYIDIR